MVVLKILRDRVMFVVSVTMLWENSDSLTLVCFRAMLLYTVGMLFVIRVAVLVVRVVWWTRLGQRLHG